MRRMNASELCSVISSLNILESLSVVRDVGYDLQLDDISPPPSYLRNLKLVGVMPRLPEWVKKLENLVKLKICFLTSSQDEQDGAMRALGNLPNLTVLRLEAYIWFQR